MVSIIRQIKSKSQGVKNSIHQLTSQNNIRRILFPLSEFRFSNEKSIGQVNKGYFI